MFCPQGQVQTKRHFDNIHRIRSDESIKQRAQEKRGNSVHAKGFDEPVNDQGQKHGLATPAGLDHFTKIDLDHDGVHHEEQAYGNGYRHHGRIVDMDCQTVQIAGHPGCHFSQKNTGDDTQNHPHR